MGQPRAPGSEVPSPWVMSPAPRDQRLAPGSPPPLPRGAQRLWRQGANRCGVRPAPRPGPSSRRGGPSGQRCAAQAQVEDVPRGHGGGAGTGRPAARGSAGAERAPRQKAGWCVASPVTLRPFKERLGGRMRLPRALRQDLHTKGAVVPHRPLVRRKAIVPERGGPAGSTRSSAHRRAAEGPPSGLSARISGDSRLNALRYFMSRAAAGPGPVNACFCLLHYFIYIF